LFIVPVIKPVLSIGVLVQRDQQRKSDAEHNQRHKEVAVSKNCGGFSAVCHLRTDSRITGAFSAMLEPCARML
jgi:hypothetical protein